MEKSTGRTVGRGALIVALLLTAIGPWRGDAAGDPSLWLNCRNGAGDQILTIICDRVVREAPMVAGAYGFSVRITEGDATVSDVGEADLVLDVEVTATSPRSQFAKKRIDVALTGRHPGTTEDSWTSEMTAEGVPRDLVHPVADAILDRLEAFLGATGPR